MREFACYIVDEGTDHRDRLTLTAAEVEDARRQARSNPITPLIVARIEQKAMGKGFSITSSPATLYDIAKQILLGRTSNGLSIHSHKSL